MIKVDISRNAQHQLTTFIMTGHAGAGEYGEDIVCAAVSVLAITTVNALDAVAGVHPEITSDDDNGGYLKVVMHDRNQAAETILATFTLGLTQVAQKYSQFMTISDGHFI
ncbi:ribosomal-processing cysteine protease Prp [Furfurilactobacillus sp. WILCCON 0119]